MYICIFMCTAWPYFYIYMAESVFPQGRYNATFSPGAATANASIPILTDNHDEEFEQFRLRLFIDGTVYQQCIFSGSVSTATVSIIPGIY